PNQGVRQLRIGYAELTSNEGVCECEQQSNTNTDQECRVDQTGQNEHLGLQGVHQFRLASGSFQILAAHDSDTDGCADSAQTDDKAASQSYKCDVRHDNSLKVKVENKKSENKTVLLLAES